MGLSTHRCVARHGDLRAWFSQQPALSYAVLVLPRPANDTWIGLSPEPLSLDDATAWVQRPDCGAVVTFTGLVRDHSEGRPAVSELEYEAYEGEVERRLGLLAADMRSRWPALGRIVLLHRSGVLSLSDIAVIVSVSAPHRDAAFDACRYGIDTLKSTVPIWKRERWSDGESWGLDGAVPTAILRTESV
ncbi:MAG: molybdenum cofactor biosynthesis protein MoaE [Actinobacteria bacterium]|nr:molybdenum cofactor biosynthesis protein MoaE [Actinomycetota bacterium]